MKWLNHKKSQDSNLKQRLSRQNARIILPQKVEEVYTLGTVYSMTQQRREELHNMRISIKRLRYTMEFFAINYDSRFDDLISQLSLDLQDILGDIHDSDVVLEVLMQIIKNSCQATELPGVDTLITRTQDTRNIYYEAISR